MNDDLKKETQKTVNHMNKWLENFEEDKLFVPMVQKIRAQKQWQLKALETTPTLVSGDAHNNLHEVCRRESVF